MITDSIPTLPFRPAWAHKGTFGTCMIVGGSRNMVGALMLAGRGALRSGVGLCRLALPGSLAPLIPVSVSEATTLCLEEEQGAASLESLSTILGSLNRVRAIGIGPGLSQAGSVSALVLALLRKLDLPMVLDADGLSALGSDPEVVQAVVPPVVLTPHPGEAARLLSYESAEQVQEDRRAAARELALRTGACVVLKGEGTIVQEPPSSEGESSTARHFFNKTGNPGMATGGSGDVLTGIITGLLAQGMPPFEAAVLAVHAHGLAGDLAVKQGSEVGLIAGDIVAALPAAWKLLGSR